jgi:hypothetical protein
MGVRRINTEIDAKKNRKEEEEEEKKKKTECYFQRNGKV